MNLNRWQRVILSGTLVALAVLAAFPPWRCVDQGVVHHTRAPLWAPPAGFTWDDIRFDCEDPRLAADRLLASWGVVAALGAALALAAGPSLRRS